MKTTRKTHKTQRRSAFWHSVVRGMAAPALIYGGFSPSITVIEVPTVSPPQRGANVWQAVGDDIRTAIGKHEQASS